MNKRNFVTGFQPGKADFDGIQNDIESGLNRVARVIAGKGIESGFTVTIAGSTATVTAGRAFDGVGNPIVATAPVTVDLGTITRPATGKYKWATIVLKYQVAEAGSVVDLYNNTHPAQYQDSLAALILEGAEGTVDAITPPAHTNTQVPIIDIRVDHATAWEDLVTDSGRRPALIATATASARITKLQADFDAMFPVGTIWMYDGAGWRDNVTLPGWYACVPENEDGGTAGLNYGITSMVDRFVMGKAVAGAGATGGANSYQLTASQLPAHTHTINHDHAAFKASAASNHHTHDFHVTAASAGNHTHLVYGTIYSGGGANGLEAGNNRNLDNHAEGTSSAGAHTHTVRGRTGANASSHRHDVNVPAYTGNSGSTGTGAEIDNRPAFYSLIFIRKCA